MNGMRLDSARVFSLGAGAYAAHYGGHSWAKVKLPAVPTDESTVAPDDIWALGTASALQWNGTKWTTTGLPELPLPKGATVSYSNLTAAGPNDAWLLRTISSPSRIPATTVMHWNGKSWLTAASPADIDGSTAPDGHGGLWANGIDVNPGGFWLPYHLVAGHWTTGYPPTGVDNHAPGDPHLDPRHPLALGDRLGVQPQGLRRSNPQVRGLNSKTDYPERTVASPTSTQGWGHSRYRRFMAANGLAGLPSRVRGAQSVQDEGGSGRIGVTRRPGHDRTAGT